MFFCENVQEQSSERKKKKRKGQKCIDGVLDPDSIQQRKGSACGILETSVAPSGKGTQEITGGVLVEEEQPRSKRKKRNDADDGQGLPANSYQEDLQPSSIAGNVVGCSQKVDDVRWDGQLLHEVSLPSVQTSHCCNLLQM
jgi:hypothetical protein